MSRSTLWRLHPLSAEDLEVLVRRGVELRASDITAEALEAITSASDGDARVALTTLDTAIVLARAEPTTRDVVEVEHVAQARDGRLYHQSRDTHFDQISAFIKSVRGSDPDGALYWLVTHARERREPAVPRATTRHPRERGHRAGRSHGPRARRRRGAHRRVHRPARGSTHAGARHDHAGLDAQEQLGHARARRGDARRAGGRTRSRSPITCAARTTAARPNRASAPTISTRTTTTAAGSPSSTCPTRSSVSATSTQSTTVAKRRWSNSGASWCSEKTRPILSPR